MFLFPARLPHVELLAAILISQRSVNRPPAYRSAVDAALHRLGDTVEEPNCLAARLGRDIPVRFACIFSDKAPSEEEKLWYHSFSSI